MTTDLSTTVEEGTCPLRGILDRLGDKWCAYVITRLSFGPKRYNELRREIDGISQRMLTRTLRGLERDGYVSRTVHPSVPPSVNYALTDLGESLYRAIVDLDAWASVHADDVLSARAAYDAARS